MSLIAHLFGKSVTISPGQSRRLDAWRALPEPDLGTAHLLLRHVVVDVESSGLDMHSDRLIAIGAVAIADARIVYADSFHAVLRQEQASSDANILVHGIGGSAQTGGCDPAEALLGFLEYIGKSPLIGFHAPFDDVMIRKAMRRYLGEAFRRTWLDLAWLAPSICPERARKSKNLDDWMAAFGIVNFSRHDAVADALATGQLFQVLQQVASGHDTRSTSELIEAARSQEWMDKQRR